MNVDAHPIRVYLTPPGVCGFIGGCATALLGTCALAARLPRMDSLRVLMRRTRNACLAARHPFRPGVCWL